MKGGAAESRVRKFGGGREKKKKVPKIETRSDRRGKKDRERVCEKEGVFVSERHSLSRGRAERNNGRKDGGMKG